MLPQVITTPFSVVAVPSHNDERVRLILDKCWKDSLLSYSVTRGRFTTTGVFKPEDFAVEGHIDVLRAGKLMTFIFHLSETGRESGLIRGLSGSVTDIACDETHVTINRLPTWGVLNLNNRSQAFGSFGENGRQLTSISPHRRPAMGTDLSEKVMWRQR